MIARTGVNIATSASSTQVNAGPSSSKSSSASFVQKHLQATSARASNFNKPVSQVSREVVEVVQCLNVLFPEKIANAYRTLLLQTDDFNAQLLECDNWTLLHQCIYRLNTIPADKREQLFNMTKYLVANEAKIDLLDSRERSPICFAGGVEDGAFNVKFFDFLVKIGAQVNRSFDEETTPLHVACSLPGKNIEEFMKAGADPYVLDVFGRTPLQCLAIHGAQYFKANKGNLITLLAKGPAATESKDEFNKYPLYYAIVCGEPDFWPLILEASSIDVVEYVRDLIKKKGLPKTKDELRNWQTFYKTRDPIYQISSFLEETKNWPFFEKDSTKIISLLNNAIQEKQVLRKGYYVHHNGQGWIHCVFDKKSQDCFTESRQEFIEKTEEEGPRFFPDLIKTRAEYEEFLETSIDTWVENGADRNNPYVKWSKPIGAEQGKETSWVMIKGFDNPAGAYVVPIHIINS